ncbi:MAG: phage gp6-like head-tail connector protein, partial [Prevotella sp.]|nr:phage gp6-like head-tail connector protein [Prevotella sp.]
MQADMERDLLEMYGEAAEETVLDVIRRSMIDVILTYGGIPKRLIQATLLLVGQSYQHREPASSQNMYAVPYSFDLLLKPLMRLAG